MCVLYYSYYLLHTERKHSKLTGEPQDRLTRHFSTMMQTHTPVIMCSVSYAK